VGPKPSHGLGLASDPGAGSLVKALGLDDGERYLAVEKGVVGEVDALFAAFAEEVADFVSAVCERGWGRGFYVR
jgi:hypothetical protein